MLQLSFIGIVWYTLVWCTVGLVNRDKNIHTTQRLFGVGGELLDMEQGDIDICVSG